MIRIIKSATGPCKKQRPSLLANVDAGKRCGPRAGCRTGQRLVERMAVRWMTSVLKGHIRRRHRASAPRGDGKEARASRIFSRALLAMPDWPAVQIITDRDGVRAGISDETSLQEFSIMVSLNLIPTAFVFDIRSGLGLSFGATDFKLE